MKVLKLELKGNTPEAIANCLEQIVLELRAEAKNGDEINSGEIYFAGVNGTKSYVDEDEERAIYEKEAGYKLSDNQVQFCIDADDQGFGIAFNYSGRNMYGKFCPSVIVEQFTDSLTTAASYKEDSMGLDKILYARF